MLRLLRYIGHRLYTTWATLWFVLPFVVTYPVQWALSRRPRWHRQLHQLNRGWSAFSIRMWGMPVEVVWKNRLPAGQPCVYVANHSSYIDIPLLFKAIPGWLNIMGKSSLTHVPLWGPIFGSSYITVDRDSAVSRGRAMVQARRSLAAGRSVVIFPEGTISERPGEVMLPFKDGAFQLAIAAGVPVVPISMPLNHRFLPDVGGLRVRYSPLRIVLHEPLFTTGLTSADAEQLKNQAYAIIAGEFGPHTAGIPEPSTLRQTAPSGPAQSSAPNQQELALPNS
ncbi:lysophospholipid acyltransferase family protein [Hymenobacter weizhouensis]|uniref:lysophospholipid acyltransferase family protein n=1 Tax=Hymenobacter sp. YIM 151500-1 TaxID=2987689 RepID=UPI0022266897|nr:lysophospholipid acyltransferase family protein [Hymenobacter sp. YIM 151500-1]UYZ63279.1 1-acyl-sn-glycerol-3-phosphate acyltransferase [Hymenobacter sp. YIM 151500-1]